MLKEMDRMSHFVRSISGDQVKGQKLVRMAYLDEAGISNPKHEPFIVVAGIIVDADNQWKKVEDNLNSIIEEFIPEDEQEACIFHATELFSGGKRFPREKWPREKRWEILSEILSIPEKLNLPIIYGDINRAKFSPIDSIGISGVVEQAHAFACFGCVRSLQQWMKEFTPENEVALLIAENNHLSRRFIQDVLAIVRQPKTIQRNPDLYPLDRIIETVHFAEKTHSSLLQIADACAFIIKRQLMKAKDSEQFYQLIEKQLIHFRRR
jgi:hypothetical protein